MIIEFKIFQNFKSDIISNFVLSRCKNPWFSSYFVRDILQIIAFIYRLLKTHVFATINFFPKWVFQQSNNYFRGSKSVLALEFSEITLSGTNFLLKIFTWEHRLWDSHEILAFSLNNLENSRGLYFLAEKIVQLVQFLIPTNFGCP